jgi:hypothetical protein
MTANDPTSPKAFDADEMLERPEANEDVEGHGFRWPVQPSGDDVEGHVAKSEAVLDESDDAGGQSASDDDDVEGHSVKIRF